LFVTRNGIALGTTSVTVPPGAYTHVEWLTTIHPTAGTTQVWFNGVSVLALTSQNTRNSANSSANQVFLGNKGGSGGVVAQFDDIVIYDQQPTDLQGNPDIHSQVGDVGCYWLLPTGAGSNTTWAPNGAATNYGCVNEATNDGDTTYVSSSTIGQIDTYAMADLPASVVNVKSFAVMPFARKDDVGSRSMAAALRSNSANFVGPTIALGNTYQYYFNNWGQNPGSTPTPTPWTPTSINALEIGIEEIS
jgi:hypothetical protein